jgi:hypothetical protein
VRIDINIAIMLVAAVIVLWAKKAVGYETNQLLLKANFTT